jgi:hypothetical protein
MRTLILVLMLAAAAPAQHNRLTPQEKKEGFVLLFNGISLDGWDGAPGLWSVENGAIVGSTDNQKLPHNTFLIYQKPYADFILRFDVKLRNNNSGMQFRSTRLEDHIITGYQADVSDAGERSAWGNFYEERGRGRNVMKTTDEGWQKAKAVLKKGDWNSYEVFAQGNHIKLTFNGLVTIDTTDDKASSGLIAVQLHMGDPMRVELRNIRIKDLKK